MADPIVPTKGGKGFTYKHFTSSSTWTAPAGVTRVWVLAHGGGGGGSGGRNATYDISNPGFGTVPILRETTVTPNTTYTITIGQGGTGGAARTSATQNGGAGGNTTFGGLLTFTGAVGSGSTPTFTGTVAVTSTNNDLFVDTVRNSGYEIDTQSSFTTLSAYSAGYKGAPGWVGSTPGTGGASGGTGTGSAGGNATGYGAGGGSGGGGQSGGGAGGNGAPGQLWVMWIE